MGIERGVDDMANIVKLDSPQKVNIMEWAVNHLNCDALIESGKGDVDNMYVVAYSLNAEGNQELKTESLKNSQYGIFGGLDSSMLNYIGGLR